MADISKCNDTKCPSRDRCYRFTAPSGLWQSYINTHREADEMNCIFFLPINNN